MSQTVRRPPERAVPARHRAPSPAGQVFMIPGYAILPLRLFLGVTFIYAGWQKITDSGFFTLGSRTYIGTQLVQFGHNSPIGGFLRHLAEQAVLVGWLTILTEMAIGIAVLFGLFTRLAALGGLILNLIFFLSASWSVYPYFLGSDIVFVAAWLTLAITGPGAYALDPLVADMVAEVTTRPVQRLLMGSWQPLEVTAGRSSPLAVRTLEGEPLTTNTEEQTAIGDRRLANGERRTTMLSRREALVGAAVTGVLVILGLAPRAKLNASPVSAPATAVPQASGAPTPTAVSSSPAIVNLSQLPANSAFATTDPKSGDPAVIVHAADDHVYAYDAVCTHAGCTVQYYPGYKFLICPCHGGAFDPTKAAEVVAGPPPAPLTQLPIKVDSSGNVRFS